MDGNILREDIEGSDFFLDQLNRNIAEDRPG